MKTCDVCGAAYEPLDIPSVHIFYSLDPWILESLELCSSCSEDVLRTVAANMQLKEENRDS